MLPYLRYLTILFVLRTTMLDDRLSGPILRIFYNTHTDGEHEPITGVWGQSPQWRSRGQSPRWVIRGAKPPEADINFQRICYSFAPK